MYVLSAEWEGVELTPNTQYADRPEASILALARALVASPLWQEIPGAIISVRLMPRPLLGIFGRFDSAAEVRLEMLRWMVSNVPARLRYVTYAQAETDCETLAIRLLERFGRDELRRFRFAAIPRGGFIVLGMLSYILGLKPTQLEVPSQHQHTAPLVVVDDCALTGARFGRFLRSCPGQEIIFAQLYSHPNLRAAIEAREPRVMACLSAQDLSDHAPEHYGDEYLAWQKRWIARSSNSCYWIGQPDHVCFAWNEPDLTFWNPVTRQEESGWRFIPPELCLKNRKAPGTETDHVQVQLEGPGPLQVASRVLIGNFAGQIVVGNIETRMTFGLKGVAADMWRTLVDQGNLEDAVSALSEDYHVNELTLKTDLQAFMESLLKQGLLENKQADRCIVTSEKKSLTE
jgi:hypothetical protein